MFNVGITGGIGSGKSTVCRLFAARGVAVYDCDAAAKRLMAEDEALIRLDLDGANVTKGDQWDMGQRIREVEEGPDGTIWLLEDAPGGRLLQLTPPQ